MRSASEHAIDSAVSRYRFSVLICCKVIVFKRTSTRRGWLMMLLLRKEGSYFVPSLCVPLGHPRSVSGRVGRLYVGV